VFLGIYPGVDLNNHPIASGVYFFMAKSGDIINPEDNHNKFTWFNMDRTLLDTSRVCSPTG